MTSYHVGEGINTLHKVSLIPGGSEVLVYTTLSGSIGILVPFSSKEVIKIFDKCVPSHSPFLPNGSYLVTVLCY